MTDSDETVLVLAGAGISRGAGIPLASEIIQKLRSEHPSCFKQGEAYTYSQALDRVFSGTRGQKGRRRFFESLCAGCAPHDEHFGLAHLLSHHKISHILTTNFDHLIESATLALCAYPPRVYLYDEYVDPQNEGGNQPMLLKLHGDFLFDDLANLEEEIRNRITDGMRQKLRVLLGRARLVVIGYGGNDSSVMDLLDLAASDSGQLQGGLLWVHRGPADGVSGRVRQLFRRMQDAGKPAELSGPTDARRFIDQWCRSSGVGLPGTVSFGVPAFGPGLPRHYESYFGVPQQLLPEYEPPSESRDALELLTRQLEEAPSPQFIWLSGPSGSGKSAIIGEICRRRPGETRFYYDFRFATRPAPLDFRRHLSSYAASLQIDWAGRADSAGLAEALARRGVAFFIESFVIPRWEGESWVGATEILREVGGVIAGCIRAGAGTVVLSSALDSSAEVASQLGRIVADTDPATNPMSDPGLGIPFSHVTLGVTGAPLHDVQRQRDIVSRLLQGPAAVLAQTEILSLLTYAERRETIARLSGQPNANASVRLLSQEGALDVRGPRLALRWPISIGMRLRRPRLLRRRPKVASLLAAAAQSEDPYWRVHHELEAENLFFDSGRDAEGVRALLRVSDSLRRLDRSYYRGTVWDWFARAEADAQLRRSLAPVDFCKFVEVVLTAGSSDKGPEYGVRLERMVKWVIDLAFADPRTPSSQVVVAELASALGAQDLQRLASRRALHQLNGKKDPHLRAWRELVDSVDEDVSPSRRLAEARSARALFTELRESERVDEAVAAEVSALLAAGRVERAHSTAMKQIADGTVYSGLNEARGLVYGNAFVTSLSRAGRRRSRPDRGAEGFLYESNLNLAYVGRWDLVLKHYLQLSQYVTNNPSLTGLPSTSALEQFIVATVRSLPQDCLSDSGRRVLWRYFESLLDHYLQTGTEKDIIRVMRDFLDLMTDLRDAVPFLAFFVERLPVLWHKLGRQACETEILHTKVVFPRSVTSLCTLALRALQEPQTQPAQLLAGAGLGPESLPVIDRVRKSSQAHRAGASRRTSGSGS